MPVPTITRPPQCRGIRETQQLLLERACSVTDLVAAVLRDIDESSALGAFVEVADGEALRWAEQVDREIARSGAAAFHARPLLGMTISVKDLFQTEQLPTARGSMLPNQRPAADAPAVSRVRAAGALVIGKTTTSENGWSASTVNRRTSTTRNPWALDRTTGGSSGGSAAAVAAGLGTASLGTDGAGSLRIPAAFCGVVGFKPSFGRVPYVPPCPDRLAHAGPLARSVQDAARIMTVIAGRDPRDPDSQAPPADPGPATERLRIAWLEFPGTTTAVRRATDSARQALAALGHVVEPIDVPFADPYDSLVALLAASEAAATAPSEEAWCDPDRLVLVRHGRSLTGADVMRAEAVRLALRARLGSVMDTYDLLASATVPIEPFEAEEIAPRWAAAPADLTWLAWTPATYPFNLTGQPAVSLPAGLTDTGLPAGVQLVGRVGQDDLVLAAAAELEAALGLELVPPTHDWKGRRP